MFNEQSDGSSGGKTAVAFFFDHQAVNMCRWGLRWGNHRLAFFFDQPTTCAKLCGCEGIRLDAFHHGGIVSTAIVGVWVSRVACVTTHTRLVDPFSGLTLFQFLVGEGRGVDVWMIDYRL